MKKKVNRKVTSEQIHRLKIAILKYKQMPKIHPQVRKSQIAGVQSMIDQLEKELHGSN